MAEHPSHRSSMMEPASHPPLDGAPWADLRETHAAVVLLLGDRAYKLKKPVDLGFLDFTTRAAREAACHREVELNRRFAPDVYLGVADVLGPDGQVVDHLVVMRRMPDRRRLATMVATGEAPHEVEAGVRALAHVVATAHAAAPPTAAAARAASTAALAKRWDDNLAVLDEAAGTTLDPAVVARVARRARRYLAGRDRLLRRRIAEGRARDGHGDLLAADVFLLEDGPRALDCIEFDEQLRLGDVLADVAFLAMDLERLGRPDLAAAFLDRYRELTADSWPASLAHHHIAYRAGVRAKVACIREQQRPGSGGDEAHAHLALADRHLDAGRVRLVAVTGPPRSGKSTLARRCAEHLGAVELRSDEVRKELVGLPARTHLPAPVGEGVYRQEARAATYAAVLQRAADLLALGEQVVLDATFLERRWQQAVEQLAEQADADLTVLRCSAPPDVLDARAARRVADDDPSDATPEVVRALAAAEHRWPGAVSIDTSGGAGLAAAAALEAIARTP